jgi:uncharacterized protein YjbI with pentapeptide repeats
MDGVFTSDYRDLNQPQNFVWRSPQEQALAALYFLRAGAVESFHIRINYMRAIDPDFMIDLRNADLANLPLWRVNLSRSDLRGALLDWTDLKYGSLAGADLSGASLVGASLMGTNLRRANLSGADLRGVNLTDAIMEGCNLTGAILGEIPEEWFLKNPQYRKGASQSLPEQTGREDEKFQRPSMDGLGGNYSATKRVYTNNTQQKAANAMAELEAQARKKREQDDRNFAKWQQKKKSEKKFAAKKSAQQNKYLEQKKQDQRVFEKKRMEQEQFLERQRKKK